MIGRTLGHYRILEKLGEGGMGVVYRAHDAQLDRDVAIKVLPASSFRDATARARLLREARAAAALNHPNICTIHEVGEAEGQAYIAMEYVAGQALSARLAPGALPAEQVLRYGLQLSDALTHAHERGVMHRDLKSANVILTPEGRAKVLDFGLAKRLSEAELAEATTQSQATLTRPGALVGTLAYMAPEQLRGQGADARSDVWALGVVLYEMTAGVRPFQGQTGFELSLAIFNQAPPPLPGKAPMELRAIIERCLEKEPERRYQRGGEVRAALEAIQTGAVAPWAAWRYSLARIGLARRPWLALAGTGVVLLVVLVAVLLGLNVGGLRERRRGGASMPRIDSLAVLPLENLSGDPGQEYFADGMTEALITDLGKIASLRVIARPTVMKYKGTRAALPVIAQELKVDALVLGSVARAGDRARISAQLIHPATDRQVWSESYEREVRDILALQGQVARAIAGEIGAKATAPGPARRPSAGQVNPQAYDHYLRGKFLVGRSRNDADSRAGIELLERAVALDAAFALAHATLAFAYVTRFFAVAPQEQPELEPKAYAALQKALSLDPDLAEAYLARGRMMWTPSNRFPHEKAIREYRRALALNPNSDLTRTMLAQVYAHIGLLDEALQEAQQASVINPAGPQPPFQMAFALDMGGKYAQALPLWMGLPQDFNTAVVGSHIALALFALGRKAEAWAKTEEFLKLDSRDTGGALAAAQALLLADAGQESRAEEKIRRALEKKGSGHFHHAAYRIGCAYARLNKPREALEWLKQTADTGFPCYPLFERDPLLNPLRHDPGFLEWLAAQKQQWEQYKARLGK